VTMPPFSSISICLWMAGRERFLKKANLLMEQGPRL